MSSRAQELVDLLAFYSITEPNIVNRIGYTYIYDIIDDDFLEVIDEAIRKGNPLEVENTHLLCLIAFYGFEGLLDTFIELKYDLNVQDKKGHTPLIIATSNNRSVMVQKLLTNKADPLIVDNKGHTALHWAAIDERVEIAKELITHIGINTLNYNGETPLHRAFDAIRTNIVTRFLEWGADPTIKNKDGKTVRDLAVEDDYEENVLALDSYK